MSGGAGAAGAPPGVSSHFISVWHTAGYPRSSDDNQISLPLVQHGTHEFIVSWGDGSTDEITSWDAPATTRTYPAVGTYTVDIVGVISGWRFTHAGVDMVEWGEAGKLEEGVQWGSLSLGDTFAQFWGAANLVITATDASDLTQTTSLSCACSDCSYLESIFSLGAWDVSGAPSGRNEAVPKAVVDRDRLRPLDGLFTSLLVGSDRGRSGSEADEHAPHRNLTSESERISVIVGSRRARGC